MPHDHTMATCDMATIWQPDPSWTQPTGGCAGSRRGARARLTFSRQPLANWSRVTNFALRRRYMAGGALCGDDRRQELERLWREFFLDPTLWWDNRRDKKSSRSPDFIREGSGEVLWLDNSSNPVWVDEQLVAMDRRMGHGASTSKSSCSGKAEPSRRAGYPMGVTPVTVSVLCEQGKLGEAVATLESLAQGGSPVSQSLLYAVLKLCARKKNLAVGRRVHDLIINLGYESNTYLGNHILRMYAGFGELQLAMDVFTRVGKPDAFMWFSIISAHAKHGEPSEAIRLYHSMHRSGVKPDGHVFVAALQACAFAADLESGRKVHSDFLRSGIPSNLFLGSCLVDMYAKCGELKYARQIFDSLPTKNVVTWNSLIAGYANQRLFQEAFVLYGEMEQKGLVLADHVTFACLLKACASSCAIVEGRQLHSQILERGHLENGVVVGNCLVDMYAKCGELEVARIVFESLATKDVVTWTSLVAAYANHGLCQEALLLYGRMEREGLILGNHITFACLLKACASDGALEKGRELHSQIVERGMLDNLLVGNCLVDMYAKCGQLDDARGVFDSLPRKNVATWTALIAGYAQQGLPQEAIGLYGQMEQEGQVLADSVALSCLLRACASAGALQEGRHLHSQILESGQLQSDMLVGNCLIDMYAKCGELEDARRVFNSLASKDVVTWTTLVAGYAQQGLGQEALVLYHRMEQEGLILADAVTFSCLLRVCASIGALQEGRELHSQIVERGQLDSDIQLGTCLVDMYAKCGDLEDARRTFDSLASRDVATWTALISGYGTCDEGHNALACFEEMLVAGVQPDDSTFTCVLVACAHEGLVTEGRKHFTGMEQQGVKPNIQHYNCMIDLLARAGHLDEAENMLLSCESEGNVVGLTSLLFACKSHGDIERATRCFESLVRLDPQGASAYMLMANVYADGGRWTDVEKIERQRLLAGARKKPAVAGIEVANEVHTFVVGEYRDDLSLKVESMNVCLKGVGGHIPQTKLVMKPLSEKQKEDVLCGHAEKLALAYGLLNTPSGTRLLVTKDLRMCSDCHSSTEIMSRVEKRQIVVRDGYRVHRFAAGCCSCKGRP